MKILRKKYRSENQTVASYLFSEIAEKYKNRNGGYTKVLNLDHRRGDNAQMACILLV